MKNVVLVCVDFDNFEHPCYEIISKGSKCYTIEKYSNLIGDRTNVKWKIPIKLCESRNYDLEDILDYFANRSKGSSEYLISKGSVVQCS